MNREINYIKFSIYYLIYNTFFFVSWLISSEIGISYIKNDILQFITLIPIIWLVIGIHPIAFLFGLYFQFKHNINKALVLKLALIIFGVGIFEVIIFFIRILNSMYMLPLIPILIIIFAFQSINFIIGTVVINKLRKEKSFVYENGKISK